MQCLFVRHGEAGYQAATDRERELTERGQAQAGAAAGWLADNWSPQKIIVSPYRRARQTAAAFLQYVPTLVEENHHAVTPDAPLVELERLVENAGVERLLLVGHNPLFSYAVKHFCGLDEVLAPASMALMELPVVAAGVGRLCWLRHAPNYEMIARRQ